MAGAQGEGRALPRILVVDPGAEDYRRLLLAQWPGLTVDLAHSAAEAVPLAPQADVVITLAQLLTQPAAAAMTRVRWLQALSTGVDGIVRVKDSLPRDLVVTSARGVHGPQMSEMAFVHMLTLLRRVDRMVHNKDAAKWERWPQGLLFDKTVVIVGMGVIAASLAARCKAFGMRVVGVTQTVRPEPHFDQVLPRSQIKTALGQADFTILLLPLDDTSRNLFDADMLAAIKPGGFLINLARGAIVDETALLRALESGALGGAGLDAFAVEPLPADSPLWAADRLFLTPHAGGVSDVYAAQVAPILLGNLRCWIEGRPQDMINRVG